MSIWWLVDEGPSWQRKRPLFFQLELMFYSFQTNLAYVSPLRIAEPGCELQTMVVSSSNLMRKLDFFKVADGLLR